MALSMGVGIVESEVMGQVLDPSRGLGMTGGWGVSGETITWYCSYAGTPRSYFESLSTSGPCWGWVHAIGGLTVDSGAGMTEGVGWDENEKGSVGDILWAGTGER